MSFKIGSYSIGPEFPPYIIAEMSANHGNSIEHAIETLHAMKESGADAIKLQTYTADTITIRSDRPEFHISAGTQWDGQQLHDLYDKASMPWEWQPILKQKADELKIDLFSSPFDPTAVDFLEEMNVPAYKIASFEIVDIPLIQKVASLDKPLILSTGMASEEEIENAVQAARDAGATDIALLKCTSAYPAPPNEANLRTIADLSERFNVIAGLSDHTLGITVPITAVALGACIIEKHFTLNRDEGGPDSLFSLEPDEFAQLVTATKTAWEALGTVRYEPTKKEKDNRIFRRSLFVVQDIAEGEEFTSENIRSIRPSLGVSPAMLPTILGKKAKISLIKGTPFSLEFVA